MNNPKNFFKHRLILIPGEYVEKNLHRWKVSHHFYKMIYICLNIFIIFSSSFVVGLSALVLSKLIWTEWPFWYFILTAGLTALTVLFGSVMNFFLIKEKYHATRQYLDEMASYKLLLEQKRYSKKRIDYHLAIRILAIKGVHEAHSEYYSNKPYDAKPLNINDYKYARKKWEYLAVRHRISNLWFVILKLIIFSVTAVLVILNLYAIRFNDYEETKIYFVIIACLAAFATFLTSLLSFFVLRKRAMNAAVKIRKIRDETKLFEAKKDRYASNSSNRNEVFLSTVNNIKYSDN